MIAFLISLLLAMVSFVGGDLESASIDHPPCWEDEVVVLVVWDPYDTVDADYGCVAGDNLPVTGNRPQP